MKSSDSITLLTKYKLLLVLLALLAAAFIFLATSRYGAGLTPDLVDYIGTARNIIAGAGFNTYDGNPIVSWPPLYPVLLALVSVIFRSDPLFLANVLNAFIFGLIVYVGGVLTFKHLSTFPALAFVGTLAILVSIPLFKVSIMAWSEPLFILLLLLGLLFAKSYLEKKDILSLMLLSISVALASLTRYIGVTLILWGVFIIIGFYRDTLKNKLVHLSLFTLISFPPIGIWLIRNYVISSTLFGPRTSSAHGLSQNLIAVFNSLKIWYIPGIIADHLPTTLIFLGVVFSFFVGLNLKDNWQSMKVVLRQDSSIIVFIIVYTTFLVISSTTSAFDAINDRLLSPIYVPLTLLLLNLCPNVS